MSTIAVTSVHKTSVSRQGWAVTDVGAALNACTSFHSPLANCLDWTSRFEFAFANVLQVASGFRLAVYNSLAQSVSNGSFEKVSSSFQNICSRIAPVVKWVAPLDITSIKCKIEELPSKTREIVLALAERGWFFDFWFDLSTISEIHDLLKCGEFNRIEQMLRDHYELNIGRIEDRAIELFPHRASLVASGLAAYRNGDYALSILALFTQADGMCNEVLGGHFFRSDRKKPRTAKYVSGIQHDDFLRAMLCPLEITTAINANENERGEELTALNRHMVLHGDTVDFGTKDNALKAISLLEYVVCVCEDAKEENV